MPTTINNNNNIPQLVFVILKYPCVEFYSFVQICSSKLIYLTHVYTIYLMYYNNRISQCTPALIPGAQTICTNKN